MHRVGQEQVVELHDLVWLLQLSGCLDPRRRLGHGRRVEAEHLDRQLVVVVHRNSGGGADRVRGRGVDVGPRRGGVHRRRRKKLVGHAVVFGNAPAADLGPDVVATARRDDREVLAGELGHRRQLVLHRAELVERVLQLNRQQLRDDAVDRFEREAAARQIHLSSGRDDVRLVAGVHDERFAIDADNRLKQ